MHNFESNALRMKNDDVFNTMQINKFIMKHIQDHIDHPTDIFTDLFVCSMGKNVIAVDAGGASTQALDTFANKMCHAYF